MKLERVVDIIATLISALVFFFIFIRPEIGNYGKVSKEISYPLMSYASLGQDFEMVIHQRWPSSIDASPVDKYKGQRVLSLYDESSSLPNILYIEKNALIDGIIFMSDDFSKSEATEALSELSKTLSDEYTNGKGLRRYKKKNNYIYNRHQGVIMHISREKNGSQYYVQVTISKYNLWHHIQSLVSSSF